MDESIPIVPNSAEQRDVDRVKAIKLQSPGARVIHEALLREGSEQLSRSSAALAYSGAAAGLAMGLSLVAQGVLHHHLPDTPWRPLVTSLGYSVGFLVVVLGHQELYTENTVIAALPALEEPKRSTIRNVARLWSVVLVANLIGAFMFAWAAVRTPAFAPELQDVFRLIGAEALQHTPGTAFIKGIFGGWIIALIAWLLPGAETAKIWIVVFLTYVIAASDMTHIIAGSVDVFVLVASGQASFGAYLIGYGLPVLLGNTIGGVVFVAALNHVQVASS